MAWRDLAPQNFYVVRLAPGQPMTIVEGSAHLWEARQRARLLNRISMDTQMAPEWRASYTVWPRWKATKMRLMVGAN